MSNFFLNHSFRVVDAELYGLEGAIMVDFLRRELSFAQATDKYIKEVDNRHYYSAKFNKNVMSEIFPYWSEYTITIIKKKLMDEGKIISVNGNSTWVTIPDEYEVAVSHSPPVHHEMKKSEKKPAKKKGPLDKLSEAHQEAAGRLMDKFSPYWNEGYPIASAHREQAAILFLLKNYKYERTRDMIDKAIRLIEAGDPYSPKAYTPRDLQTKWIKIDKYQESGNSYQPKPQGTKLSSF